MKLDHISFGALIFIFFTFLSSFSFSKNGILRYDRGIIISTDSVKMKVELISPVIIHIESTTNEFSNQKSLIVEEMNLPIPHWSIKEFPKEIYIYTDSLQIRFLWTTGNLNFYKDSSLILQEFNKHFSDRNSSRLNEIEVGQTFLLSENEALYGLGQHQNGFFNLRNKSIELVQSNTEVAVPFIVSTNNYGILWDNYSETHFSSALNKMSLLSKVGNEINYYFIYSRDLDGIIYKYRNLTGQAPLYPKWAYGYFQSKNRYWTQDELLKTVDKYRKLSIPLDVIVLDYMHWGQYGFGSFRFDELSFPNPERMIDSLHHNYNCRIMVSVWPSFSKNTPNWEMMNSKGYLLDVNSYEDSQVYDAYNPSAGKLYWGLLKNSYFKLGVDGWWFDATEPERMAEYRNSDNFLGSSEKYLNTYSLVDVKNVYLGQREASSDKRVFILTRSAFAGQQKYAAATWSGDIGTTVKDLKNSVTAGLNFCMSGIPYWTTDIGGYKGGDPNDPAYRELYIRWFQYGTFCPLFRAHGRRAPGDRKTPNSIWSYGNQAQAILTDFSNLRYRLMPYIYSNAWQITAKGSTIMRALVFDFKHDKRVYLIDDQFMFGRSLMINPVTKVKTIKRDVYLPDGSEWFDFWTGREYNGGQSVTAAASLDRIPIFVKAGSILPLGPYLHYATEKPANPVELRVYGNANAEIEIYEDENDNFNYEKGNYSIIKVKWNNEKRTLTFFDREGKFPGMLNERTFNVILVRSNHGRGIGIEKSIDRVVRYSGNNIIEKF